MGKRNRRPRKHGNGSEAFSGRFTPPTRPQPGPGTPPAGSAGDSGRADRGPGGGGGHRTDRPYNGVSPAAGDLVTAAVHASRTGDRKAVERLLDLMEAPASAPAVRQLVDAALAEELVHRVRGAWESGWQPADLLRLAGRRLSSPEGDLLTTAVLVDHRSYPPALVEPRWSEQVRALTDAAALPDPGSGSGWVGRAGERRRSAIEACVGLLAWILSLPRLPQLCPLPGHGTSRGHRPHPVDADALRRVRALLAKAESTSFEEEAQALTAKAQELMSRHAIDRAALAATSHDRQAPVGVRLGVDDPYARAKALLLGRVADANRCQAVWSKDLGFGTVFGFLEDIEDVELLYTSLLVQAQVAMVALGSRRTADGRSRTRSFRQSFLVGYATRIGERLHHAAEAAEGAAVGEHGRSLLPVLADRRQAVVDEMEAVFPELSHVSTAATYDAEGWVAGAAAADLAALWGNAEVGDRATG